MTTVFTCDECRFVTEVPGAGEQVIDRIVRLIERQATALEESRVKAASDAR